MYRDMQHNGGEEAATVSASIGPFSSCVPIPTLRKVLLRSGIVEASDAVIGAQLCKPSLISRSEIHYYFAPKSNLYELSNAHVSACFTF
jgi:hypothetical protein